MLRTIFGILLFLAGMSGDLAFAEDAPAPVDHAGKPIIAVLPLKEEGMGSFGNQQDEMYQTVTSSFFQTRRFELMERGQLAEVLGEGKFQNAGSVDDASAVALGKQLGVKFVVLGSYSGTMNRSRESYESNKGTQYNEVWPAQATVSLRMVSVETGRIEETFKATGTAKESNSTRSMSAAMRDLSVKLNREVSNKFPLNGYIIKVTTEHEAMIDLGRKDGVVDGDRFLVVEWGADIIHPITGKTIKGQKTVLAELKVTRADEETSEVKIAGSKLKLKVGQVLESATKKAGIWESLKDK